MIQYNMEYTASIRIDRHSDSNLFCNTFSTVSRDSTLATAALSLYLLLDHFRNWEWKRTWKICMKRLLYFWTLRASHSTCHINRWKWMDLEHVQFFFPLLRWFSIVSTFFFFIANMCEMSTNRTRFQVRIISRLKIAGFSLQKWFKIE